MTHRPNSNECNLNVHSVFLHRDQMLYLAFQNITLFDDRFLREDSIQILSQRVCFWLLPATKNVKRGRLDLIKDRTHVI